MAFRGLKTNTYILLERKKEKNKTKPRGWKFKMVCKQQQRNKFRILNENDFQARVLHQVRLRIKSDKRMEISVIKVIEKFNSHNPFSQETTGGDSSTTWGSKHKKAMASNPGNIRPNIR